MPWEKPSHSERAGIGQTNGATIVAEAVFWLSGGLLAGKPLVGWKLGGAGVRGAERGVVTTVALAYVGSLALRGVGAEFGDGGLHRGNASLNPIG